MLGVHDTVDPAVSAEAPCGTLFNEKFDSFSKRTGIEARDLWRAGDAQTAATARLFILAHLNGTVRAKRQRCALFSPFFSVSAPRWSPRRVCTSHSCSLRHTADAR